MEKFEVKTIDEIKSESKDESEFNEKLTEYIDKVNGEYKTLYAKFCKREKDLEIYIRAMSIVENICECSEKDFVELDAIHDILDRYV